MKRDSLMAVGVFCVGLLMIFGGAHASRGYPDYMLVGPLLLVSVGVVIRRRAPVGALVVGLVGIAGDLVLGPSTGTVLIFTDNLYSAALYGPRRLARWMLWIAAPVVVVSGVVALVLNQGWISILLWTVQAGLVILTPITTAVIVRQHWDQVHLERERAEQMARLAELDRRAAVVAERSRMARELHDMIANHFSAIAIQSTAVLSRNDLETPVVRRVLESIRENSVEGMSEMRTMIGLLRQDNDEVEAVRHRLADANQLVERSRQAGVRVELRISGVPRDLPAAMDLAGYRIVQEALTNVLKHGEAKGLVSIDYEDDRIVVVIENPVAERTAVLPGAQSGLIGMKERASLVGGTLEAGPFDGGWRVRAEFSQSAAPKIPARKMDS
ncbi:sensor histidine kinase [Sinosporangium siamense]|nr:histidine kinase [Sinosporangium siamense]